MAWPTKGSTDKKGKKGGKKGVPPKRGGKGGKQDKQGNCNK